MSNSTETPAIDIEAEIGPDIDHKLWDELGCYRGCSLTKAKRREIIIQCISSFPHKSSRQIAEHLGWCSAYEVAGYRGHRSRLKGLGLENLDGIEPPSDSPLQTESPTAKCNTRVTSPDTSERKIPRRPGPDRRPILDIAWRRAILEGEHASDYQRLLSVLRHMQEVVDSYGKEVFWLHPSSLNKRSGWPVNKCKELIRRAVASEILDSSEPVRRFVSHTGLWCTTIYYRLRDDIRKPPPWRPITARILCGGCGEVFKPNEAGNCAICKSPGEHAFAEP